VSAMARLRLCVSLDTWDRFDKLAVHYRYSVTQLVEDLAARTERNVTARLSGAPLKDYYAGYEDDRPVPA
jgi:hypothetical protein